MDADPDRARELLERARALSSRREYRELAATLEPLPRDELLGEPELGFLLADVLRRLGKAETALDLSRAVRPEAARRGNYRLGRLCLNLEGMALFDLGRVELAESAWGELLHLSSESRDDEMVARVNNNLGVIHTLQNRPAPALAAYGRAVTAYQRLGYRRGLAQSHHNLAINYRELGFLTEADEHFLRAAEYARADSSEDELARVEQERALLLFYAGDPEFAEASARRGLARYGRLGDPTGQAECYRILGIIALGSGRKAAAAGYFQEALELAEGAGASLLVAETLEALATVDDLEERASQAIVRRAEAVQRFQALNAVSWGQKCRAQLQAIARGEHPLPGPERDQVQRPPA